MSNRPFLNLKRFISLYYGSLSVKTSISSIAYFLTVPFQSARKNRTKLNIIISSFLNDIPKGIFTFGSARSSLGAFLKSVNIGSGDEVLLSSYSCLAVPTGVIFSGAKPVYADIDPLTLNLSLNSISAAITTKVKAIVLQHTLGNVASVKEIINFANQRGIFVIEDCALSIGSVSDNLQVGVSGDAAIFSMELSKTLSCGWGGVLVINNEQLVSKFDHYYQTVSEQSIWSSGRDHFQTITSAIFHKANLYNWFGKYCLHIGYQSGIFRKSTPVEEFDGILSPTFLQKMGHFQVKLAIRQWMNFNFIKAKCSANYKELNAQLINCGYRVPADEKESTLAVTPRISFYVKDVSTAEAFFMKEGIELGRWFSGPLSPLPKSTIFQYNKNSFPFASLSANHIVNLPCHSGITSSDISFMKLILSKFSFEYPEQISFEFKTK